MQSYCIKIFILHFVIALTYMVITSYEFVVYKVPDPIGTGLQQWACFFFHLTITLIIMSLYWGKAKNKKIAKKKFWINFLILMLIIALVSAIDEPLWKWLWKLR